MLGCAMVAILAIRSDCLQQFRIWYCLKSFKITTMAVILDTGTEWFSNSESPFHPDASHQVSTQPDVWRISRWPWQPSWILKWNDYSNFEFLCHCDASHQVSAQSDLGFRRTWSFEEFQDGRRGGHPGHRNGTFLAILNLCVTVMPPIKFQLNQTSAQ